MPSFDAHVQYDDLKGTAAADRSDGETLADYLRKNSLINEGEFVINTTVYLGKDGFFNANVLLSDADDIQAALQENPVRVRSVNLDIDQQTFFSFFKRFEVSISQYDVAGREYQD